MSEEEAMKPAGPRVPRRFAPPSSLLFAASLLAVLAVAPALGQARQLDPDSAATVPRAESIVLERAGEEIEHGRVVARVAVEWSRPALEKMAGETGRLDRVTAGGTTFRDDGLAPDDIAGDGVFHALLGFEVERLEAKSARDLAALEAGARDVAFEKRVKVASREIEPFDFEGFMAGRAVELRPSTHAFETPLASDDRGSLKVPGTNAFQEKVLAIRHPSVVRDFSRTYDPCTGGGAGMGPWSFGFLMREMANFPTYSIPPEVMVDNWLAHWTAPQVINTHNAPPRPPINAWINDWRAASGGSLLDLSIAPFRLLAILPRVDLRSSTGGALGPFNNAGEARFVFGAVAPSSWPSSSFLPGPVTSGGCKLLPFTVIFEYKVYLNSCPDVQNWANSWIALNGMALGSPAYRAHLETLTSAFTLAGLAPPNPFDSSLGQLRTNENAFNPLWELREFHLVSGTGLAMTETEDNADNMFQGGALFHDYVQDFNAGLVTSVPTIFKGVNFRTGNPEVPINGALLEPLFYWDELGLVPGGFIGARHDVSLASCNGCHGGETRTPFVHVSPTAPMPPAPAALSLFMTGFNLNDPAVDQAIADGRYGGPPVTRPFDALEDREADIAAVSSWVCPVPVVAASPSSAPVKSRATVALEDLLREPMTHVH